jgi:hypothetical protein
MTNLDPCLRGCDLALAEADRLVQLLVDCPDSLDHEIDAVRLRIAALRSEVERLRGIPTFVPGRKVHPKWIDLPGEGSPWATDNGQSGGNWLVRP